MSAANLEIYRGVAQPMEYNHPVAMTGGTLYFTVKEDQYDDDADDSDALPKKTITAFTNADLTASWTLTDADTYIEPGDYYYDIVFEDADGLSQPPIFNGKLKILPHPTNRNVGNE